MLFAANRTLDEYDSHNDGLSKFLFVLLKRGGLRAHVNALNAAGQCAMQMLCEWSELIETSFLEPLPPAPVTAPQQCSSDGKTADKLATTATANVAAAAAAADEAELAAAALADALAARRHKWQREFEDCVRLLLKVSYTPVHTHITVMIGQGPFWLILFSSAKSSVRIRLLLTVSNKLIDVDLGGLFR